MFVKQTQELVAAIEANDDGGSGDVSEVIETLNDNNAVIVAAIVKQTQDLVAAIEANDDGGSGDVSEVIETLNDNNAVLVAAITKLGVDIMASIENGADRNIAYAADNRNQIIMAIDRNCAAIVQAIGEADDVTTHTYFTSNAAVGFYRIIPLEELFNKLTLKTVGGTSMSDYIVEHYIKNGVTTKEIKIKLTALWCGFKYVLGNPRGECGTLFFDCDDPSVQDFKTSVVQLFIPKGAVYNPSVQNYSIPAVEDAINAALDCFVTLNCELIA